MVKNKRQLSQLSGECEVVNKKKPKSAAERRAARRLKADPEKYGHYLKKQKEYMQKKRKNMSKLEKLSTNMKESARRKELRAKKKNTVKTPDPVVSSAAYATDSC